MTRSAAPQRLYLHVGLPKSGTSHLQGLLAESRPAVRAAGFVYPFVRPEGMFHAAVELRGQEALWGLDPALVRGTWAALLDRVREQGGTGIVSHEILAGAAPAVVDRALADAADFEVHLVVTVRDLGRQAVAHWQEEVKNGRPWSFAEFEAALFGPEESADQELGFWRSQDLLGVVRRWGAGLHRERVHLVTVPPGGAGRDVLPRRFAEAVGLPAEVVTSWSATPGAANRSLGVAEVALLREVVAALDGRLGQPAYAHVVKRWFAQRLLASRGGPGPQAPAPLARTLRDIADGWVETLHGAGYSVHGDLADLLPVVDDTAVHPDDVDADELRRLAPSVVADLLVEVARLRQAEQRVEAAREPRPPRRWLPGSRRNP